ncbi:MAG TPA: hypothetical protein VFU15_03615, partial [Bacteroidia bacterium]|nr:hypothetical protein [Bacteroidia bacterium]
MKQFFITFSCFLLPAFLFSQELFPNTEPASNMPKGVLAFRIAGEYYSEVGQPRIWTGYRFKYGFTARMEADLTIGLSNHHGDLLPPGFVSTDGNIGPHTHGGKKGIYYPYRFEGIDIYAKYRFLNIDGEHRHFRMAAYAEISTARVAHDETEPNLMMEDNAGAGGGIVATYLYHKLAVSTTLGGIFPVAFSGHQEMPNNERGPDITIHY